MHGNDKYHTPENGVLIRTTLEGSGSSPPHPGRRARLDAGFPGRCGFPVLPGHKFHQPRFRSDRALAISRKLGFLEVGGIDMPVLHVDGLPKARSDYREKDLLVSWRPCAA